MTDRKNMVDRIEDLLGSEGSRDLASAMMDELEQRGHVTFDPQEGYRLAEVSEREWMEIMQTADTTLPPDNHSVTVRIFDAGAREPHTATTVPTSRVRATLAKHGCDGDRYSVRYHEGSRQSQLADDALIGCHSEGTLPL